MEAMPYLPHVHRVHVYHLKATAPVQRNLSETTFRDVKKKWSFQTGCLILSGFQWWKEMFSSGKMIFPDRVVFPLGVFLDRFHCTTYRYAAGRLLCQSQLRCNEQNVFVIVMIMYGIDYFGH